MYAPPLLIVLDIDFRCDSSTTSTRSWTATLTCTCGGDRLSLKALAKSNRRSYDWHWLCFTTCQQHGSEVKSSGETHLFGDNTVRFVFPQLQAGVQHLCVQRSASVLSQTLCCRSLQPRGCTYNRQVSDVGHVRNPVYHSRVYTSHGEANDDMIVGVRDRTLDPKSETEIERL